MCKLEKQERTETVKKWEKIKDWEKVDGWLINPETGNKYASIGDGASIGYGASIGDGYNLPIPPLWFSGPQYSIGYHSPNTVVSGCIKKPIQWWEENIKRCAEENKYTPDEVKEYMFRIKCLSEWMKMWGVYDKD